MTDRIDPGGDNTMEIAMSRAMARDLYPLLCQDRDGCLRRLDAGAIGAVRSRIVVDRAGFAREQQALVDRRGERGARVAVTNPGIRIGAAAERIAAPRGGGERPDPLAEVVAEVRRELVDREGREVALLQLARERAAEVALDQRRAERPQVIAAGRGAVGRSEEARLHRQVVRVLDLQEYLVGEPER